MFHIVLQDNNRPVFHFVGLPPPLGHPDKNKDFLDNHNHNYNNRYHHSHSHRNNCIMEYKDKDIHNQKISFHHGGNDHHHVQNDYHHHA